MEELMLKGTEKTPEINFNSKTGQLFIGGRSYSSQSMDFYKTVNEWLNEYLKDPRESTVLEVKVDYFHSVSVKYLTSIVKKLAHLQESGKSAHVKWYHEIDENGENEALELGKSIQTLSKMKIEFIEMAS